MGSLATKALWKAAEEGNADGISRSVMFGAEVDEGDSENQNSAALHYAAVCLLLVRTHMC